MLLDLKYLADHARAKIPGPVSENPITSPATSPAHSTECREKPTRTLTSPALMGCADVVFGKGTTSAKIQAEASAHAQRHNRVREMRRAAYLELIEQAHLSGQLRWRVGDAYVQLPEHDARLERIQELRAELRAAFDPLIRSCQIVVLEGPQPVADIADALVEAAREANRALWDVSRGENDARKHFEATGQTFRLRLEQFTHAAQVAMATA